MSQRNMLHLVEFATRRKDKHGNYKWQTYATNKPTVESICAASNLGLIVINDHGQFKATSKAKPYLDQFDYDYTPYPEKLVFNRPNLQISE